jgi:hypothetical protein
MEYYAIEVSSGVLDREDVAWLNDETIDNFVIKSQERWDIGRVKCSAMYSHSTLIVYFCNEEDALRFKLQLVDSGPYNWKP